jgi:hypothetical protein
LAAVRLQPRLPKRNLRISLLSSEEKLYPSKFWRKIEESCTMDNSISILAQRLCYEIVDDLKRSEVLKD